jgi:hypothetical protein
MVGEIVEAYGELSDDTRLGKNYHRCSLVIQQSFVRFHITRLSGAKSQAIVHSTMRVLQRAVFGKLPYERLTCATCGVEDDFWCRIRHASKVRGWKALSRATGIVESDVWCRMRHRKYPHNAHVPTQRTVFALSPTRCIYCIQHAISQRHGSN